MNNAANKTTTTSIWGTLTVDTFSVAFAVATGDMAAALSLTTGAAIVEDTEKQFAGSMDSDESWASL